MFEWFGLRTWQGKVHVMPKAHQHNEIEVNFIARGSTTYNFNAERVTFPEGHLALFWGAIPHQLTACDQGTQMHWVTVPLQEFLRWRLPDPFVHQLLKGRLITQPSESYLSADRLAFVRWQHDWGSSSNEAHKIVMLEIEARLRRLAVVTNFNSPPIILPYSRDKVAQMMLIIAESFAEPLSVVAIAERVHLHPKYAAVVFQKTVGMSITNYLIQHRVAHAQRLLVTTDLRIANVAFDSGFGSISHFNAIFREHCGTTPRLYRQALQNQVAKPAAGQTD